MQDADDVQAKGHDQVMMMMRSIQRSDCLELESDGLYLIPAECNTNRTKTQILTTAQIHTAMRKVNEIRDELIETGHSFMVSQTIPLHFWCTIDVESEESYLFTVGANSLKHLTLRVSSTHLAALLL